MASTYCAEYNSKHCSTWGSRQQLTGDEDSYLPNGKLLCLWKYKAIETVHEGLKPNLNDLCANTSLRLLLYWTSLLSTFVWTGDGKQTSGGLYSRVDPSAQRIHSYFIQGSITEWLISNLTGLDLTKQVNLSLISMWWSYRIWTTQSGGQQNCDTSAFEVSEFMRIFWLFAKFWKRKMCKGLRFSKL